MRYFVGFDNHLPATALKPGLDDEPIGDHVCAEACRRFQHPAKVDLGKTTVLHSLFDVGR